MSVLQVLGVLMSAPTLQALPCAPVHLDMTWMKMERCARTGMNVRKTMDSVIKSVSTKREAGSVDVRLDII